MAKSTTLEKTRFLRAPQVLQYVCFTLIGVAVQTVRWEAQASIVGAIVGGFAGARKDAQEISKEFDACFYARIFVIIKMHVV